MALNGTTTNTATEEFKPYVPAEVKMREFTISAVVTGTALGLIFAASSLYLVMKVGMTVSASIPVAVVAISLFRVFSKSTILENNIVQTAGSAGESIAFGVGVTMPALLMLGFDMSLTRVMVVSILGGILGILAMIPLRRAFIVKMHGRPGQPGTLLYPEGVAAAQVLMSAEKGGTTGKTVFVGFALAFLHKFATIGLKIFKETVEIPIKAINQSASFAGDMASELLGVGYIIGYRTSAIMMAGAILGYLVIIPLIYFIGIHAPDVIPPSTEKAIRDMDVDDLRKGYLTYIGAGCVAAAGIISMFKTLPMIVRSVRSGLATMKETGGEETVKRTERDMSMKTVLIGTLGLIVLLAIFLGTEVSALSAIAGALLVVLFGFLFVTVSSRLTGEIGSSSNPISGMTVATLMVTCLIFLALGWQKPEDRLLALSVAAVVCIASSNGGTTAQSLKTGFLVGGTPKAMQYAILIGALVSALVIGGTLIAFNRAGTVYTNDKEFLPKDTSGNVVVLTPEERARLNEHEKYEGKDYLIWDTRRDNFTKGDYQARKEILKVPEGTAPEGHFLVDPSAGQVAYLEDPTIGGVVKEHNGKKTTRYAAPKTKVMEVIIEGVLSGKMNWSLVLIGALIAVTLELCGVSALAFAVGIYVPIQNSVPIFFGGLVRWWVDKHLTAQAEAEAGDVANDPEARARAEIEAIKKSETSPGVLLSAGYIAGGSLAGVLITFLEFPIFERIKDGINLSKYVSRVNDYPLFKEPFVFTSGDLIALGLFALLIAFAALVGTGKIMKPPAEEPAQVE
ncbi:MAG TPA: oligopeptide transporter, OPT family [Gemmataceae bacterium]|nr:oligopeptide transporter, OPT family [Gemmataceae bacterium]